MLGADYRVLVFVGFATAAAEGFGEPVGGANKGVFGVDVLSFHQHSLAMQTSSKVLTSARCCCPVAKVLSLRAVAPEKPEVAKSGADMFTEALVDG